MTTVIIIYMEYFILISCGSMSLVNQYSKVTNGANYTQEGIQPEVKKAMKRKLDVDLHDGDDMIRSPKDTVGIDRQLDIHRSVEAPSLGEFREYQPLKPEHME